MLSMLTIAGGLFVLGFFLVLNANLQRVVGRWTESAELSVYLRTTRQPEQIAYAQRDADEERTRDVGAVRVEGRGARASSRTIFPTWRRRRPALDRNPFPASFEVRLNSDAQAASGAVDNLASTLNGVAGVADVRYDRTWLARLNAVHPRDRGVGWSSSC